MAQPYTVDFKSFLTLFVSVRKNQKLAAHRHPMFDKNRFAKVMMYFGVALWGAYFLFFGVMLPAAFRESFPSMEPYHILNQGLIIVLILDFLIRLLFPTPIQEIKPFLLLPIPKRRVMTVFLLRGGFDSFCLFWLFLFLPFSLLTVTRFYGLTGVISYCIGITLLMVMNNYWSMLIRVLKRQRFIHFFWIIPVYGLLAAFEFIPGKGWISWASMELGEGFILGRVWAFAAVIIAIALLAWINYRVQLRLIYSELDRKEDTSTRHISTYRFFDRYGEVGEYMRLELKMIFRNKAPRTQFWMLFACIIMFTVMLAAKLYEEDSVMAHFACAYCYYGLGFVTLVQVMGIEGNYIDGLMVRKGSIYTMLRAKYYLQCAFLIIPALMGIIPVAMGSIPPLMALAYLSLTAGPLFASVLQLAVYNNKALPLNATMMGRNSGGNTWQGLITGFILAAPPFLFQILEMSFSENTAYYIMIALGIIGFATHRLWIRNIYRRLMARKYKNLEAFRNSR